MTKIIFDSDCLASFLWIEQEKIVCDLYEGGIILPEVVYGELMRVRYPPFKQRLERLDLNGKIIRIPLTLGTQEFNFYHELSDSTKKGKKIIGKGEAAAISLAIHENGTLGSNNLRDVMYYVKRYNLPHITSAGILCEAFDKSMISLDQGEDYWVKMILKNRMMPADTFRDYLSLNDHL